MNFNMSSAKLLALNLQGLLDLVNRTYQQHSFIVLDQEILYRLKLLVEEYRLQALTDELFRLTKYDEEEKQTLMNIEKVHEKVIVLDEFIHNNYDDLFLFSGRVHSILSIIEAINNKR
ncbi:hypothetical protein [Bacillus sp. P14.5]|uniref:hypothetical protein n=1 Tax=Bacillus sp. P14.5 TaxID=1983400 RepID=UPI000DE81B53|nr:hypothetical protein [Bacillus sp. P14.5]